MCNSDELYKILVDINPDVIFEEIPPSWFEQYYVLQSRSNLESEAIGRYTRTRLVKQVPVDSDDVPPQNFFKAYANLNRRVKGLTSITGFNYRTTIDQLRENIFLYGFKYLNSVHSDKAYADMNFALRGGLDEINDDSLNQVLNAWKNVNDNRENHMLYAIHKYAQVNKFDKAVFTVGSAHRKSLMTKTADFRNKFKIELNWQFYNE